MGQTPSTSSKSKQTKHKNDKPKSSPKEVGNPNKIKGRKIKKPSHRLVLENVLRPNGLFPPEILELILVQLEDYALIQATMACKLWMETSIQVFKRLYLRYFCSNPQSLPENFDYVSAFIHHTIIKKHMKQNVYWAEDIALGYGCRGMVGGVGFTWTSEGNKVAINYDKTNHTSFGPYTMHTEGVLYDIEKRTRQSMRYGTHLWNGKTIIPQDSNFTAWEWNTCTVVLEEGKKNNKEIKIEREHKFVRPDTGDPWQALTCPERLTDAFPNLDGSPQILTWDRCINSGTHDFMCEVYDLNTGKQLYTWPLKKYCERIIGFYKTSVICKRKSDVAFVDLTNGNELGTLPLFQIYHIHKDKLAIAEASSPTKVSIWDLETMQILHQLDINSVGIEYGEGNEGSSIGGLAFDNWKLVVNIASTENGLLTVIFDMTDKYKKLTQICSPGVRNSSIKIALPTNGSIVLGGRQITVLDFNHPYLYGEIPIAFCSSKDSATVKIKQYNINPTDLFTQAKKLLQKEKIADLMIATYFCITGYNQYSGRVTCISALPDRQVDYYYERVGRQGIMSKILNWKKIFGVGSVISLTCLDLKEVDSEHLISGRSGVSDPCVMVFEQYDSKTHTWNICEPHWPDDVVALIEQTS